MTLWRPNRLRISDDNLVRLATSGLFFTKVHQSKQSMNVSDKAAKFVINTRPAYEFHRTPPRELCNAAM